MSNFIGAKIGKVRLSDCSIIRFSDDEFWIIGLLDSLDFWIVGLLDCSVRQAHCKGLASLLLFGGVGLLDSLGCWIIGLLGCSVHFGKLNATRQAHCKGLASLLVNFPSLTFGLQKLSLLLGGVGYFEFGAREPHPSDIPSKNKLEG
ncbi:MAG: hypothetical protein AB8B56_16525 [Crocinitomicaceae bacterium]